MGLNKLVVPERLFRIGLKNDPYCLQCSGAAIGDIEHIFCYCTKTESAWRWLKVALLALGGRDSILISNFSLLNLLFPSAPVELEIVWLVANYVHYVWDMLKSGVSREIEVEKMVKQFGNNWFEEKWRLGYQLDGLKRIFP